MLPVSTFSPVRRAIPFLRALFLLPLLLGLSVPASAGELRIATPDLGSCGFMVEGRPGGFCFELANAMARAVGMEPVNRLAPLARSVEEFAAGGTDLIIVLPEERVVTAGEDLGPVRTMPMVAWARIETPLRDVRDLGGKLVAVVRGSRYENEAGHALGIVPFPCKDHELSLKMLLAGRVQAVIGSYLGLASSMRKLGLQRRYFGDPLVLSEEVMHAYVSKRLDRAERDRLKAALDGLLRDGTVAGLRDRYPQ